MLPPLRLPIIGSGCVLFDAGMGVCLTNLIRPPAQAEAAWYGNFYSLKRLKLICLRVCVPAQLAAPAYKAGHVSNMVMSVGAMQLSLTQRLRHATQLYVCKTEVG